MPASTLQSRDARDQVIHALGLGHSYPLRDLPLTYKTMVAVDLPGHITINGSQAGVRYQLCDEDGNPVEQGGQSFFVDTQPDADAVLQTPPVTEDVTYTILASRDDAARDLRLETYLNETASIRVGVDATVAVTFAPYEQQVNLDDHQIIINYGEKVRIKVAESQEGVSYQLYEATEQQCERAQKSDALSNAWKGNGGDLFIYSRNPFNEDITLRIKAYRTTNEETCAFLDACLTVSVRPKLAVAFNVEARILDYNASTAFSLAGAQATASYRLYQRQVAPDEYVSADAGDRLEIPTDGETLLFAEGGIAGIANEAILVFIKTPEKTAEGGVPSGFAPAGDFEGDGAARSFATSVREDTLFVVQATKTFTVPATGATHEERLQLDQSVAVLARPDTAPTVGVEASPVEAEALGTVTLADTQHGVFYQLQQDPDGTLIGSPGYHYEERGVQRTRIGVDFVIEAQEPEGAGGTVLLPTEPLTETTAFTILAAKTFTGISAPLDSKAAIEVETAE